VAFGHFIFDKSDRSLVTAFKGKQKKEKEERRRGETKRRGGEREKRKREWGSRTRETRGKSAPP